MDTTPLKHPPDLAAEVASAFPGALQSIYLSCCTRGLLPTAARLALERHLDELTTGRTDKAALFDLVEDVRTRFAGLIGAAADEIALTKNVSEGLNIIAASLDWREADNAIVTLSLEHPNNVYPWLNQKARRGIEVRAIPDRDGHVDIDRMIAAIDQRTRLVTLPTVSFSPGFRADVRRLGEVCRKQGVFLLVDAVQSVGILHTDVEDLLVDGLATSTQKGLCGLYGFGFLYCRRSWAERISPVYLARFGVDLGAGVHEAATGTPNYRLMDGARRFDLGNYNYPAAAVAQKSLEILGNIGTKRIERHTTMLAARLADGLMALDLPVAGGPAGPHLGHIVSVGAVSGGHDSTDDPEMASLSRTLTDRNVIHTIRRGMLRFACHLYNSVDDIEAVLAITKGWRGQNPPGNSS